MKVMQLGSFAVGKSYNRAVTNLITAWWLYVTILLLLMLIFMQLIKYQLNSELNYFKFRTAI
jgi:hypothetical protein